MDHDIIFAGFGGQGVLFAGRILAQAAMVADKHVTWIPSYGPEMRGGTANCAVKISEKPIGAPMVVNPTAAIVMNQASFDKFAQGVKSGGLLVVNTSIIKNDEYPEDVKLIKVPANDLAHQLENDGVANMVMLGALIQCAGILTKEKVFDAVDEVVGVKRPQLIPINRKAIEAGIQHVLE